MVGLSRFALGGILAVGLLTGSGVALADYGNAAVYQVEISANSGGPDGGGAWLWIELGSDQTGTYAGSDCGHGAGAVADMGDVTWTSANGVLTITGVVLGGLHFPVTITVPSTYGHESTTIQAVFGVPFPGLAQVQVAP
jgi:hypothetical protein